MNLQHQFMTDRRLWALCSLSIFILAGCIDFVPASNKGEGLRYWEVVWDEARLNQVLCLLHTAILAIPSIALGWIMQGIILSWVGRRHLLGEKTNNSPSPANPESRS